MSILSIYDNKIKGSDVKIEKNEEVNKIPSKEESLNIENVSLIEIYKQKLSQKETEIKQEVEEFMENPWKKDR